MLKVWRRVGIDGKKYSVPFKYCVSWHTPDDSLGCDVYLDRTDPLDSLLRDERNSWEYNRFEDGCMRRKARFISPNEFRST